jgi:ferric-dicitrate binding protein FerR (iron transport regulator)
MNRVEELTSKLIDGDISDGEFEELARWLADDPQAMMLHAALLDVEAALLSRLERFDVAPQTMARIRELAREPQPEPIRVVADHRGVSRRRSSRRLVRFALAASLLALVAGGVVYYYPRFSAAPVDAQVVQADEGVVIERNGRSLPASTGLRLTADDRLVVPATAAVSIAYSDNTRITFGPQATATLLSGRGPTKRISLKSGDLVAHVSKQAAGASLEASTPTARVRVLGTRFLLAATPTSTRLDVLEGRVNLTRYSDGAAIEVSRGQSAVASTGSPLVAEPLPERITSDLIALYRFDEGQGTTVHDQSGFGPPLDLHAESAEGLRWLPSGGLQVAGGAMLTSGRPAAKIIKACRESNELTIEVWVTPSRAQQAGPARIVTLSRDTDQRDFTLGHGRRLETPSEGDECYLARVRTTRKDKNGEPAIHSPVHTALPQLTHVVFTRSRDGMERLYVDGILRVQGVHGGDFSTWDPSCRLALGDEFTHNRAWDGTYHLVAIYERALDEGEVRGNFRAGW